MNSDISLHQVAYVTDESAEDLASVLLEREVGSTPSIHTDALTRQSTVSVYVELASARVPEVRRALGLAWKEAAVGDATLGTARIRIRKVRPLDWAESWKRHFRPLEIGHKLLVKPTWSRKRARAGESVILLDPGLSFGTGQHATTHFCLTQVVGLRTEASQSLLDLGCGSGILGLAAARLGYQPVEAWDYDAEAVRIAGENAELNQLGMVVHPKVADVVQLPIHPKERFDVVCANLIYDLLIAERERIIAHVAEGGRLVLAGILTQQFPAVTNAYAELGWKLSNSATGGEWTSGTFRQ